MQKPVLSILLTVLLAACQQTPVTQRGLEATRVAKIVSDGGSTTLMGALKLPGSIVSNNGASYRVLTLDPEVPLPQATVQVVDAKGIPLPDLPAVSSDDRGGFSLPRVPVGISLLVQGRFAVGGREVILRKYLRGSESLTCANMDLASTLVAEKLTSKSPLVADDPGLAGSDLFELADPAKLAQVESALRATLRGDAVPSSAAIAEALSTGKSSQIFDQVAAESPAIREAYQQIFQRPESTLGVRIAAVGQNRAKVPQADGPLVIGVMQLKVFGVPPDTVRIEYWLAGKKLLETQDLTGKAALDTWSLPNGPCTIEGIAVRADGSREVVTRNYMVIRNSLELHCPS